jgi:hypothetical protein
MRKNRLFLATAAVFVFANACGENGRLPTDASELKSVTSNATSCASYEGMVALTNVVYGSGSPNAKSALAKLKTVNEDLGKNHLSQAREHAMNLIDFIAKSARLQHSTGQSRLPGTPAQINELVNDILCFVTIAGTVTDAEEAFVVTPADPQDTIVNVEATAGVVLPPNVVSEPTIITIEPIPFTSTGPGTGPLNTKLDQYPGYYYLSQLSATNAPLLSPVTVAVCPAASVPVSIRARLRLGHDASTGFELTPPANADFLVCPVEAPSIQASSTGMKGVTLLSKTASITLAGATGGVGGTTGTFSPFGTVDYNLSATGGVGGTTGTFIQLGGMSVAAMFDGRPLAVTATCTEAPLGSAVTQACRPTVTIQTLLGTKLENVPVTFAVTQGGGATAGDAGGTCGLFGSSAVVTTSNFGVAIACWNLGAAAGMNTIVATPSTGGDVPATAIFTPATLTFNVNGVVVDDTPPVIADPVVTGTEGKNGWYTSDVSVTWAVSDPETSFTSNGCSATLASNSAGTTFTCSATNAVGLTSTRSITIKRDDVAPTIAVDVAGTKGKDDWYISDVTVDWTPASAGLSGLGVLSGCDDFAVTTDGTFSYECAAESGAGVKTTRSVAFKRDASAPVISAALSGTKGKNDWYTTDVGVDWTATPSGPSGLGILSGCSDFTVNSDGTFSYDCVAESGAGVSATRNVAFKRDASVPSVSVSVTGTKGTEDWYVSNVGVTWSVAAAGPSGLGSTTGCVNTTVSTDGNFSFSCAVESGAGVSSTTVTASGKRDGTVPTVTYTGNLGSYGVDNTVSIACSASDATSGVLSSTCQPTQGPAYNFTVGQNSRSADATDHAGNIGHGSTSFTVVLTTTNLCSLTKMFSTSANVASSMCTKLDNAAKAAARGDLKAKAGMINAFTEEVKAQSGKALTATQAQVLTTLALKL